VQFDQGCIDGPGWGSPCGDADARRPRETLGYGGTLDLIAELDGETWLLDWKTGKSVAWPALALPQKIALARPTGVGRAISTYTIPIEGRDEWLAAARRLA